MTIPVWVLAGDDYLHRDADNDTLLGRAGNDKLFGENQDDSLTGGLGIDRLDGEGGATRFILTA